MTENDELNLARTNTVPIRSKIEWKYLWIWRVWDI